MNSTLFSLVEKRRYGRQRFLPKNEEIRVATKDTQVLRQADWNRLGNVKLKDSSMKVSKTIINPEEDGAQEVAESWRLTGKKEVTKFKENAFKIPP